MSYSPISPGPASTKRLLEKLNLAIDEARLVRKIVSLGDQLRKIENQPGENDRVQSLQQEIDHSEDQLVILRSMMESVAISYGFA